MLKTLNVEKNQIDGFDPNMGRLTRLVNLNLSFNYITFIPETFANMSNLR